MKITIDDLSFGFGKKIILDHFNLSIENEKLPTVILGPSGCGKTTLLRLIAGILMPSNGMINREGSINENITGASFVFQESRFLPWMSILENISLPLEKIFGKSESRDRALHYLKLVSMEERASSCPADLSGGQRQRASIARAFAYPSELLLMDEPFQSLDIPMRIELMELCISLLENEDRVSVMVTHDPREAVFMGSRIIILGQPPSGIIYDEKVTLPKSEREYGAAAAGVLEKILISILAHETRSGI